MLPIARDRGASTEEATVRLLYFVPYLSDPAVHRRLRMLRLGGLEGILAIGFRRTPETVATIDGIPTIDLGRTYDNRLGRRALSVAKAVLRLDRWGQHVGDSSVIMARSLEALLLASAFRSRFAPRTALVYESLDIHATLLGGNILATSLRSLEARLLTDCRLIITSSPAFVREYFHRFHPHIEPITLLENKMLATEIDQELFETLRAARASVCRTAGPPWRIGWFGLLRCPRSLELLASLCRQFAGQVEVVIRGRPAANVGDRLRTVAESTPGMACYGPYNRATDLASIYSDVHFSWTMDFSESGANSDWLLPNRLYEAGPFGCVPLALASVETGRWLAARKAGILLDEPVDLSLPRWFSTLTRASFEATRAAMLKLPMNDFVDTADDAGAFVARLAEL